MMGNNQLKQICITITDRQCRDFFSQQRTEVLVTILESIGDSIILAPEDKSDIGVKLEDISWSLIYNDAKTVADKVEVALFNENCIIIDYESMAFFLRASLIGETLYFDSISSVILKPKDSADGEPSENICKRFAKQRATKV